MEVIAVKTRKFLPPKDKLSELLKYIQPRLKEKMIVVITSKVVSICEGSTQFIKNIAEKDQIVMAQSQRYLPRRFVPGGLVMHTLKNGFLIPSAGIDESNGGGHYIFWPEDPKRSAKKIWRFLRRRSKIKKFGVIITDSHSIPLRRGVIGFSLAYFGFKPLRDYRGKADLFGRKLSTSMTNIPDSLAATAVFSMGEGREQTPIALIRGCYSVEFISGEWRPQVPQSSFEDLVFWFV